MERLTAKTGEVCFAKGFDWDKLLCQNNIDVFKAVVDRLASYEDAEEAGILLRLPCKVGDTVYSLDEVEEVDVVHEINFGRTSKGDLRLLFLCEMGVSFYDNDVGKTVFLTREEAEAALAKER